MRIIAMQEMKLTLEVSEEFIECRIQKNFAALLLGMPKSGVLEVS